jgi:hypothetical protein
MGLGVTVWLKPHPQFRKRVPIHPTYVGWRDLKTADNVPDFAIEAQLPLSCKPSGGVFSRVS